MERMKEIMSMKENIRQICVFGLGQPILKALSSDPRLLAPETMSKGDAPMALYYRMDEGLENTFLVNITSCPKVADLSLEFSASLSVVDGALIGVNMDEGFSSECESFLRQALYESVVPLLSIDVPDILTTVTTVTEGVEGNDSYGEEIYCKISELVKKGNAIVDKYENKLMEDIKFDPRKGNVCFCSLSFGWAFTLDDLARFWSPTVRMDSSLLLEKLWGDSFYDWETKEWSTVHTGSKSCVRAFVHFFINFGMAILKNCMEGNLKRLETLQAVKNKQQFVEKKGTSLYKEVIQKFFPASRVFFEMIISKLPSVGRAQRYRTSHLYSGPLNDIYANSIRACSPYSSPVVYISRIVIDGETNETIAYARIYSGTIRTGMKLCILDPGTGNKSVPVEATLIIWIGNQKREVDRVCCGNNFGIRGIDQLDCTLTSDKIKKLFPIRPISFHLIKNMEIKDVILNSKSASDPRTFSLPYEVYNGDFFHQRQCMDWFWRLHCINEKGGILADDMGLGKTREVCTFLRGLFHSQLITKAIIVAPLSVAHNWKPELLNVGLQCQMFTQGIHLDALENVAKEGGILVTTYETVRIHVDKISRKLGTIDYLFADEGHRLKNQEAKTTKALTSIKCDRRFVVTGTPIQNNLMGFYSLMKFCNPRLLGSEEHFKKTFMIPIDQGKYKGSTPKAIREGMESAKALNQLISPFLLRRTKTTLKDSGRIKASKYDVIVWVKISPYQINLYKALLNDPNPKREELGQAFEVLKVAKAICLDPRVVGRQSAENISKQFASILEKRVNTLKSTGQITSSKLNFLLYFLPHLLKDKHKILVFSTSPKMLQLLQDFKREDGPSIFLLTMRVGGMGLNLISASRVIIINPSDNPCDDNQAVDRAYRLGQEKDVIVYRLICCSTIEGHLCRRQMGMKHKRLVDLISRRVKYMPVHELVTAI